MRSETTFHSDGPAHTFLKALAVCWHAVCVPVHALLAIMEPIVSLILGLLAVVGVGVSLAFELLHPDFPFWTMMATSLSFVVALMLYHAIMRLTAPR